MRPLMTKLEVAEATGTTVSWVRSAVRRKILPIVRVGRLLRFRPEDIEKWIEQQRSPARKER